MLGDEQGNQTLACNGMETLTPYFWLLHASCSHILFCLVVLNPSIPARFLSHSSEPPLCSLLSSSSCVCSSLCRDSGEPPGRTPVLRQPLLLSIHLSIARSLPPPLPASRSFDYHPPPYLMHFFHRSTLSPCCTYSSAPFTSHPPPCAHLHSNFSIVLLRWTSELLSPHLLKARNNNLLCCFCTNSTTWLTTFRQSQIEGTLPFGNHMESRSEVPNGNEGDTKEPEDWNEEWMKWIMRYCTDPKGPALFLKDRFAGWTNATMTGRGPTDTISHENQEQCVEPSASVSPGSEPQW